MSGQLDPRLNEPSAGASSDLNTRVPMLATASRHEAGSSPCDSNVAQVGFDVCGADRSFDHYARLVRRLLEVPTALVSIVETSRQVFPGASGLKEPLRTTRQTPLSLSFCRFVVQDERPLAIADTRSHPRFVGHPAIAEFGVIAYAGWPLADERGHVVGSLCAIDSAPREWATDDLEVLRDLALACSAELQQSRRVVDDAESLASTIFASSSVAMAFYGSDNRLVLSNDLAERAASAAGFRLDQAPHAADHVYRADAFTMIPGHDQFIPRALRGDLSSRGTEWWGPPGEQIAVIPSAQHVLRADNTPWGTLIGLLDVTHLARALQVKDEFLATVSHELRTPLTPIFLHLELLAEELDGMDGLVTESLNAIERAARRLHNRVEELIAGGLGDGRVKPRLTDVESLARAAVLTFDDLATRKGVRLCVQAELPGSAVLDPDRIQQAMEIIVSNAVTYTGSGGCVTLALTRSEMGVQVAVSDTGIGMTRDEIAQAFDAFWRAPAARRGAIQGLGLGLTRVRDIMASHGGSAEIVSEPGRGTSVVLKIPCDVSEA